MAKAKLEKGVLRRLAHSTLHMAQNITYTQPTIKINCNGEIWLENCRRLVTYDQESMSFDMGDKYVTLRGEKLIMQEMRREAILIRGRIITVEFSYKN